MPLFDRLKTRILKRIVEVLAMNFLNGFKTYIAAAGLLGLALYQFSQGELEPAMQSVLAALAAFGLRSAIANQSNPPSDGNPPSVPPSIPVAIVLVALFGLSGSQAKACDDATRVKIIWAWTVACNEQSAEMGQPIGQAKDAAKDESTVSADKLKSMVQPATEPTPMVAPAPASAMSYQSNCATGNCPVPSQVIYPQTRYIRVR